MNDFPAVPAYRAAKADLLHHLGNLLTGTNRPEEAEKTYRSMFELREQLAREYAVLPGHHLSLAWFRATCPDSRFRDPTQALTHARKAVELTREDGYSWRMLGVAHYRAGEWRATVEDLEKAINLRSGGDSLDWLYLAMAYQRLGNQKQAEDWYEKAAREMEKTKRPDEELHRLREEAAALLGRAKDTTREPVHP
jgi:tetratricopeptide (TPR) repeat protein